MPVLQIIAAFLVPPLGGSLAQGIGNEFWIGHRQSNLAAVRAWR